MDWFKKLSLGDKLVGGGGVLLLIDLLFLPWHNVEMDFGPFSASSRTAIESPNAFLGWLGVLLAIAMVAYVVLTRFTKVELPEAPLAWSRMSMIGGIATLAVLVLKLIVETSYLGYAAWVGLLLAAVVAYGGYLHDREAAGVVAWPRHNPKTA